MPNVSSMQFISKLRFNTQSKNKFNDFKAGSEYEPAVLLPYIPNTVWFTSSNTFHKHGKMWSWTSWSHATKLLKAIYYIPFSNTTWPTFLCKHTQNNTRGNELFSYNNFDYFKARQLCNWSYLCSALQGFDCS